MSELMPEQSKTRKPIEIGRHRAVFSTEEKHDESEVGLVKTTTQSVFGPLQEPPGTVMSDRGTGAAMTDLEREKVRAEIAKEVSGFVAGKKEQGIDITAVPKSSAFDLSLDDIDELLEETKSTSELPDIDDELLEEIQSTSELKDIDDELLEETQSTSDLKETEKETHTTVEEQKSVETLEELLDGLEMEAQTQTMTPREEMEQIFHTMQNIKDKSFVPINRPQSRIGLWGRFKNRFMVGARWIAMAATSLAAGGIMYLKEGSKEKSIKKEKLPKAQEKRGHEYVPGREGLKFDDEDDTTEVYSDVRRGPLVWEKMTAGDPDDPPEVAILVEQGQRGSYAALESGEMGHTMIGLTYSRYNKATRRKERYQIRMGFYPGGGMVNQTGTIAMLGGAIMTGQLRNDFGHHYDVARRYQVTPAQINTILREAEKYADGGYGYYQRNCTTFAVDMVKAAGLKIGNDLKPQEMRFKGKTSVIQELGQSLAPLSYWSGGALVADKLDKKDMSYHNFGQNMTTKEDVDRYKKTATHEKAIRKGYSPGALGEQLRAAEDGEQVAMYKKHRDIKYSLNRISGKLNSGGVKLWNKISELIPADKRIPEDEAFRKLIAEETRFDQKLELTSKQLRELHKTISLRMKAVNEYYRNRLGNDARLSITVLDYLGRCETYLTYINVNYNQRAIEETQGDAASLTSLFGRAQSVQYVDEKGTVQDTAISPGEYEGYLMAGVAPSEMIRYIKDWNGIGRIREEERTVEESRRYAECDRMIELVADFASANRYLLWKDNYTPEEIQYAFFDLKTKEKDFSKGRPVQGDLIDEYLPSRVYRSRMFENVFDGMSKDEQMFSGAPELDYHAMDQYLCDKLQKNKTSSERMDRIIDCYVKKMGDMGPDDIVNAIMDTLSNDYIKVMYKQKEGLVPDGIQNQVTLLLSNESFIKAEISKRVTDRWAKPASQQ